jgi:hypothetical protein
LRGLQSAERSLRISLTFCKTSGLAGGSRLGGADFGCGPSRDIRSGTATFIFFLICSLIFFSFLNANSARPVQLFKVFKIFTIGRRRLEQRECQILKIILRGIAG